MAANKTTRLTSETARQYRDKYGMDMPTLKLARIMYSENKLLFKSLDAARSTLRAIEGKVGPEKRRESIVNSKYFKKEERPKNPYNLPESDSSDISPYVVKGYKRAFVINDVHLPFHDIEAITAAFDFAKKEKPDVVILNGDIIDCYQLSFFVRDPKMRNFAYELAQFKDFFEILQKTFNCQIIFKLGNHEVRYEKFLFQKANELVGVEEFDFTNIIKARANGIIIVEDKKIIQLNKLAVVHGHEWGRGFFNPVNTARGLYLRAKVSAMQGDSHQSSEHTEKDLNGTIMTTWSIGCLCGLQPPYAPYNKWNHGVAIVDMDENRKDFEVRNYRIYKGKIL